MKKLIFGFAAVGVVMALRPVVKRRMVQKMKAHCRQMAAHCKEMMGAQHDETTGPEAMKQKMREHYEEMAPAHERPEPVAAS